MKGLIDPRLRDLYCKRYICADSLTAHALRATCRTLHNWIKIDREFIEKLRNFMKLGVYRTTWFDYHDFFGDFGVTFRHLKSPDIYVFDYDEYHYSMHLLVGEVPYPRIVKAINRTFNNDNAMDIINSIIRLEYARKIKWMIVYDVNLRCFILH